MRKLMQNAQYPLQMLQNMTKIPIYGASVTANAATSALSSGAIQTGNLVTASGQAASKAALNTLAS